jgi:hypothetical protein
VIYCSKISLGYEKLISVGGYKLGQQQLTLSREFKITPSVRANRKMKNLQYALTGGYHEV